LRPFFKLKHDRTPQPPRRIKPQARARGSPLHRRFALESGVAAYPTPRLTLIGCEAIAILCLDSVRLKFMGSCADPEIGELLTRAGPGRDGSLVRPLVRRRLRTRRVGGSCTATASSGQAAAGGASTISQPKAATRAATTSQFQIGSCPCPDLLVLLPGHVVVHDALPPLARQAGRSRAGRNRRMKLRAAYAAAATSSIAEDEETRTRVNGRVFGASFPFGLAGSSVPPPMSRI
jgi:hypothetical protein